MVRRFPKELNLIPITRQELPSLVGTSRETVTRVMSDLKKEGMVLNEQKLMWCAKE